MKRVLIVSVRAGGGHIKVAEALEAAFKADKNNFEVKNIDLLDHSSALIKFLYGKAYIDVAKFFPELYAYSYKKYEPIKKMLKPRTVLDRLNFNDFFEIVDDFRPDIVIGTHFIAGMILAKMKAKKKYKVVVTLTDYEFHPLWLVENTDLFTVATKEVAHSLEFYDIDPKKIIVSGIPIRPKFAQATNKKMLMKKYSLDSSLPIVFVFAGSSGAGSLRELIEESKRIKEKFQFVIVCGNNKKLEKELIQKQASDPRLKKVFGFVDFMDELMACSSIFITKPGGLSVSESMAKGLPMILVDPIPGQEEANADYLLEQGAAVKARDISTLVYKLRQLLKDKKKLSAMSSVAKRIAEPNAAKKVVRAVSSLK
jgi:processive 1,2-diacylglycerol beta-glucosyltransferase